MRFWDPVSEFATLRNEIDRAFDTFRANPFNPIRSARTFPAFNVREDTDGVEVDVLAPGVDPKQLDLSVQRNILTVSGEKPGLDENLAEEQVYRHERPSGYFSRTLTLPSEIDANKVKAEYENGLLHVHLPKAESAKPKKIDVAVG